MSSSRTPRALASALPSFISIDGGEPITWSMFVLDNGGALEPAELVAIRAEVDRNGQAVVGGGAGAEFVIKAVAPTIRVNRRSPYGASRIIPLCAYSVRLARAQGRNRKTISEDTLAEARKQGWTIVEYVDGVAPGGEPSILRAA